MEDNAPLPGIQKLSNLQQERENPLKPSTPHEASSISAQNISNLARRRFESKTRKAYHQAQDKHLKNELRIRFQTALTKLEKSATREVALRECTQLIERNINPDALKIFMGCLNDCKKEKHSSIREAEVIVFGLLAQIYQTNLIEKGSLNNIIKLAELIHNYFNDMSRKVHEAAARSLCDLYEFCLPKVSVEMILSFMYEPLNSIMTHGNNLNAQKGVCLAFFIWSRTLIDREETEVLDEMFPKLITLFLAIRAEYPDLISTIGLLIDSLGFKTVIPDLFTMLRKLQSYLENKSTTAYLYKIEACRLLVTIAKNLATTSDIVLGQFHYEIIESLKDARTDKVPSVQLAAKEALIEWETLQNLHTEIEERKMQSTGVATEDIIKARTGLTEFPRYLVSNHMNEIQGRPQTSVSPRRQPGGNHFQSLRQLIKEKRGQQSVEQPQFTEKYSGNYVVPVGLEEPPPEQPVVQQFIAQEQPRVTQVIAPDHIKEQPVEPEIQLPLSPAKQPLVNSDIIEIINRQSIPEVEVKGTTYDPPPKLVDAGNQSFEQLQPEPNWQPNQKISQRYQEEDEYQRYQEHVQRQYEQDVEEQDYEEEETEQREEEDERFGLLIDQAQMDGIFQLFEAFQEDMDRGFEIITERVHSADERIEEANDKLVYMSKLKQRGRPRQSTEPSKNPSLQATNEAIFVQQSETALSAASNLVPAATQTSQAVVQEVQTQIPLVSMTDEATSTSKAAGVQTVKVSARFENKNVQAFENPNARRTQSVHRSSASQTNRHEPAESIASLQRKAPSEVSDQLSELWNSALFDLSDRRVTAAYEKIIQSGDDIYLLRLMHKTGVWLDRLNSRLRNAVLVRIWLILKSYFMEALGIKWLNTAVQNGAFYELPLEDQQVFIDTCYKLSSMPNQDGVTAAQIYNHLTV